MFLWWSLIGWPWLKENWLWVLLFPLGILYLLFRLFSGSKRPVEVVTTSTVADASKVQEDAAEEANSQVERAETLRSDRVAKVTEEHIETVKNLNAEQVDKVLDLQNDPERLKDFLVGVGKGMRK